MSDELVTVYQARGHLEGEIILAFLEANSIKAGLVQESAGLTYGLTVGELGLVDVIVNQADAERAIALLTEYEENKFAVEDDEVVDPDEKGE